MLPETLSSRNLFLFAVAVLFLLQFTPLAFELRLRDSEIMTSVRSTDATVVAGFGTGVLVLILTDLLVDAFL